MVSIVGYAITEFVYFIIFFYALWFMAVLAWLSLAILQDQKMLRGLVVAVLLLIAGFALLMTPIRLGTILFMDGIAASVCGVFCFNLVKALKELIRW